jgi:predicted MFS family arabinose efflux permease
VTLSTLRALWQHRNLRVLAVTAFLTQMTFYSAVVVAFQAERGLSMTEMFLLESLLSLVIFLCEVPTGILADRLGYRRMMILGQALFLASYVLFPLAWSFGAFALSTLLYGIGLAAQSGCDSALLYESLPAAERERLSTPAFSIISAAGTAGFLLGMSAGSFMGAARPVVPVALNIIPMAAALIASLRLQPLEGQEERAGSEGSARLLVQTALSLIRHDPKLVGLRLLSTAGFALANAIFWYNQPLFARAGIAVAWFGPLTAAALVLQMLVALGSGWAERRLGVRGALVASFLAPGLAYLLLARATTAGPTALLVALVVAGGAWRQPVIGGELNRRIPDGARATALSALSFLAMCASILLNPLIGWAGDRGLPVAAAGLGLGLLLLAALTPALTGRLPSSPPD